MKNTYKVTVESTAENGSTILAQTNDKTHGGRPRKYSVDEKTKVIGVRLKTKEVSFLEEYGGKFGGKTGYVTYLIHKEMERLGIDYERLEALTPVRAFLVHRLFVLFINNNNIFLSFI